MAHLPDAGHAADVNAPVLLCALGLDDVEALCIRSDLGGIQRLLHLLDKLCLVDALHTAPLSIIRGSALLVLKRPPRAVCKESASLEPASSSSNEDKCDGSHAAAESNAGSVSVCRQCNTQPSRQEQRLSCSSTIYCSICERLQTKHCTLHTGCWVGAVAPRLPKNLAAATRWSLSPLMKRPSSAASIVGAATLSSAACCTVHLPARHTAEIGLSPRVRASQSLSLASFTSRAI